MAIASRYKITLIILAVIIAFIGLLLLFPYGEERVEHVHDFYPHKFLNLHDSVKYVGMQQCRTCHESHYRSFSETGMGQSFDYATRMKSAGNFHNLHPIYDPHLNMLYYPFWQGDSMMLMEFRIEGGDTVHKRIERVDYIIGSGHHTNSHLMGINGHLYQMPFTFYTQLRRWDLPPGYEDGRNTRFSRPIMLECMSCHNAYSDFDFSSVNKYNHIPQGIDCERCHGPGELHVQARLRGDPIDIRNDTDFTIVNPRKLPIDFQVDVCQRCHLQGNAVLKDGMNFNSFRPGMRLNQVMDVFMPVFEDEEQHFIMASHAERLQRSPCYLQSHQDPQIRAMTCFTCHNPHIGVQVTQRQFHINACLGCHTQNSGDHNDPCRESILTRTKTNQNDCIACHMPRSTTIDIPHVTITDHYIRIPRPGDAPRTPGEPVLRGLRSVTTPNPDAATLAKAFMFYYERFEPQPFLLDSARVYLNQLPAAENLPIHVYFHYLRGDFQQVVLLGRQHNFRGIETSLSNYQVGQSFQNINNLAEAERFFTRAVELQPLNLDYRNKLGTVQLMQGNVQGAQSEYEFILNEQPKNAVVLNNLGFCLLLQENVNRAEPLFRQAIALDPDYMLPVINIARVHIYREELTHAENSLRQVLRKEPNNQEALQLLELIGR